MTSDMGLSPAIPFGCRYHLKSASNIDCNTRFHGCLMKVPCNARVWNAQHTYFGRNHCTGSLVMVRDHDQIIVDYLIDISPTFV